MKKTYYVTYYYQGESDVIEIECHLFNLLSIMQEKHIEYYYISKIEEKL